MAARIEGAWHRNLRAYPEYKESGVEWLGKIPEDWAVNRLRTTVTGCQNGVWGEEADGVHDLLCVRVADFDRGRFRVRMDEPTLRAIDPRIARSRRLEHDDLLLEKSGGGDKQPVGAVVMYDHDQPAVCSNFVARMPVADDQDPRYLTYLHATLYAARVNVRSIKQNTGIQNLDSASYLSEAVAVPPVKEQHAIADFLDRETEKIDALVARKERLIELLQEKRTALITRAVTRGLDPSVPRKDSGIEWLGEVPAHWEVCRLRRVVSKFVDYRGKTPEKSMSGVPLVTARNIKNQSIDFSQSEEFIPEELYPQWMVRGRPESGDVVITTEAPLGETAQVVDTGIALAQWIVLLKVDPTKTSNDCLMYHFAADSGRMELRTRATGSTALGIKASHLKSSLIAVPPMWEQDEISQTVRSESEQVDVLIAKIREAIGKLRELRSALVSAAVTGKIDVREETPRRAASQASRSRTQSCDKL